MNAYERRKLVRDQHAKDIKRTNRSLKEIDTELFIRKFEDAWYSATGRRVQLISKNGWYIFNGKRRSREQLLSYLLFQESVQHEMELLNDSGT